MPNSQDFAVIIGIKDYVALQPLTAPGTDALLFADWLKSTSGGDLPPDNCKLILSSTDPLLPLQDQVDQAFQDIFDAISASDIKPRRLYFYFNGHGLGINTNETALVLPKWTYDFRDYALSSSRYKQHLVDKGLFAEIFIFLDCCRNRIAGVEGAKPYFSNARPATASATTSTFVFSATEFESSAFEVTNNLQPGSPQANGLFTTSLLSGLKGGACDTSKGNRITAEGLRDFISSDLPALAAKKNLVQVPRYDAQNTTGDVTICESRVAQLVSVTITFKNPNQQVKLEDPNLGELHQGDSSTPFTILLQPGRYYISLSDDSGIQKIIVPSDQTQFTYEY
ncbi:caspase family protein [Pinibacter aurantiacus]|uniref:Caspase family protein n=1 Tax=Pinibacter aurantiacus TaxID=2851599 RepID=A0A9E2W9R8_9BACT|nr:caspase family protein [Pinibacter aurantiacus]MBV4360496.1 caspase family protein [Pinibacter aurantiacus]